MTLTEKIQADFIVAMKVKNETAKAALSSLKAKITEAEKAKSNTKMTDDEVIKVMSTAIKQRKQSIEEFNKGGRPELAAKESAEIVVLQSYMPAQMSEVEIETEVRKIMESFPTPITNRQAFIGKTMGAFNKLFNGKADPLIVKNIIEKIT